MKSFIHPLGGRIAIAVLVLTPLLGCGPTTRRDSQYGASTVQPYESGNIEEMAAPADPQRGRYLATAVSLCIFCHSEIDYQADGFPPKEGKVGAGRSPFSAQLPWLTCPNLTPDHDTGAGGVPEHAFEQAIRSGIAHDGRVLHPMMPYQNYHGMSDEDVASIVAFIKSVPPVKNALPRTEIPEAIKATLTGLPPANHVVAPARSEGPSYGKYLAQLAICANCHTPKDSNGKAVPDMELAGGMILKGPWGEVAALNLTSDDSGLDGISEKIFMNAMRTGHVPGGRRLVAIMPWGYYQHMTDGDLRALYAYLKSLKPVTHFVDNATPPSHCKKCGGFHGLGDRNN